MKSTEKEMGKHQLLPFKDISSLCYFQEDYGLQFVGPVCTTEIGLVTLRSSAAVVQQIGVSRGKGYGLKI